MLVTTYITSEVVCTFQGLPPDYISIFQLIPHPIRGHSNLLESGPFVLPFIPPFYLPNYSPLCYYSPCALTGLCPAVFLLAWLVGHLVTLD
jgi:hypothetical protein